MRCAEVGTENIWPTVHDLQTKRQTVASSHFSLFFCYFFVSWLQTQSSIAVSFTFTLLNWLDLTDEGVFFFFVLFFLGESSCYSHSQSSGLKPHNLDLSRTRVHIWTWLLTWLSRTETYSTCKTTTRTPLLCNNDCGPLEAMRSGLESHDFALIQTRVMNLMSQCEWFNKNRVLCVQSLFPR